MTHGTENPLIDVEIRVTDDELASLGINKGIMHLVSEEDQERILGALEGKPRTYLPGGSAPNTLLALAGPGVPAAISGKIGDDEFGRSYSNQVGAYGIINRLVVEAGQTGSTVILVTPDDERTMNTHITLRHGAHGGSCRRGTLSRTAPALPRPC